MEAPAPSPPPPPLDLRTVFATWWPLAASWLLMGLELPAVSAVMARLPDPEVSLAAYGGVVFPLSMLIESPIIMLLSASTALARDSASYAVVRRFMRVLGGSLTALHALVAFTPLFDAVVVRLLGVPDEVREPARIGMRIMTPWTMSIAYRRTQQGLLIRFGRSGAVGIGTAVRLGSNALVLALGFGLGRWPGIVVGTAAVATGVVCEAVYAGLAVRPVRRGPLAAAARSGEPLTASRFLAFYLPLMATPLLTFLAMPMASAAMGRMSRPIESLAAWPVVNGLVFATRSVGFAFNEVVVALLERPRPLPALIRFAILLGAGSSALLLAFATTPLGALWFGRVSALAGPLARLAGEGLWILLPMPALAAVQSLHQGVVLHGRRTGAITESVAMLLVATVVVLAAGVRLYPGPGLHVAAAGLTVGTLAQVSWLAWRARAAWAGVRTSEAAAAEAAEGRPA